MLSMLCGNKKKPWRIVLIFLPRSAHNFRNTKRIITPSQGFRSDVNLVQPPCDNIVVHIVSFCPFPFFLFPRQNSFDSPPPFEGVQSFQRRRKIYSPVVSAIFHEGSSSRHEIQFRPIPAGSVTALLPAPSWRGLGVD